MRQKSITFAQIYPVNEDLSPLMRQEITLRSCLIFTEIFLLVITPFNYFSWLSTSNLHHIFYLISDILAIFFFAGIYFINDRHLTKLASALYLAGAFYISFAAYPIQHPDQLLFYLTLPTLIASLITKKEGSILVAVFAILGSIIYKIKFFPLVPYPVFSALCLLLVGLVASRVTIILDQMLSQMSTAYDKTIEGWSMALEMRNQETEGHSTRVVDMTLKLAKYMKFDERMIPHLRRGVLLHDIGKIAVPDTILCKAGPLTPGEHEVMHRHPEFAYDLLKGIPYLTLALQVPYCHHEKWDGTGYPRGLKGQEIPVEARIFSVVDVWDAMRSDRSYRKAIPENQVIEYLRCEKGRSFDPVVIEAFFKMMKFEKPEKYKSQVHYEHVQTTNKA